jgi:laccase
MDVLLTANQSLGLYYMAARHYSSNDPSITTFDYVNTTAVVQYRGNYTIPSSPEFPSTLPFYLDFIAALNFTNRIRSLANKDYQVNVPLNITKRMYITVSMNSLYCPNCSGGLGDETLGTSMNNISWVNPSTTDVLHVRLIQVVPHFSNIMLLVMLYGRFLYDYHIIRMIL